eukprot:scaffold6326_cov327-Prasinococcus_capsulatus_cf.AAC.2
MVRLIGASVDGRTGAINLENNRAVSAALCELLEAHEVPKSRVYITFHDVPRENMGYNGATFAG